MSRRYMTRRQFDRTVAVVRECEERLSVAKKKIGDAAALVDLSENAEYDAAREEAAFFSGRLSEYNSLLTGADIVDPRRLAPDMVTIGKTVCLRDPDSGEEFTYNIVGAGHTEQEKGEVSYQAPLAAGIVGKKTGAVVEVPVPGGIRTVEIVSIRPYD